VKVKVDVKGIPNFDKLSPEEKIKALTEYEVEVPDTDMSGYVTKEVFDKKASEAASLSKQLKSKMTESEIAEAESRQALDDMKAELENQKKEKMISGYKAEYLGLGYDDESAHISAAALAEGNTAKVFELQKAFIEDQKKKASANALNQQPGLTTGKPATGADATKAQEAQIRQWFGVK
jgi:hypothetical protein